MKGLDTLKWFGLGLAATLLLFFAGMRVPILGLAALPLVIYPALFVGVRLGKQAGQLLPAAAAVCLYVLAGLEAAAAYLVLALVTFLMFLSFGRGWPIARVVSGTAICTVAVMLVTASAFAGSLSTLWATLQAGVQAQVLATLEVYERMGLAGETIDFLREHAGQMAALFVQMLPGMIFLALGVMVLANLAVLSWQFPQYRSFFFEAGDLKEWKSPDHMVWLLAGTESGAFSTPWMGSARGGRERGLRLHGVLFFPRSCHRGVLFSSQEGPDVFSRAWDICSSSSSRFSRCWSSAWGSSISGATSVASSVAPRA